MRAAYLWIADRQGHAVARLPVLLSHHAALRAEPDTAPLEKAFCHQYNLAHLLRPGRVGSRGVYVDTFGEYSVPAVRNRVAAR